MAKAKGIPLDLAYLMLAGLVVGVFFGLVPEIYFHFPAKSSHSPSVILVLFIFPFGQKRNLNHGQETVAETNK